jgi:predicted nucleic acid-binding protein
MVFSSCLTEEDCELVLDSSVVINLLATGYAASILKALAMPVVLTGNVVREVEFGSSNGGQEVGLLREMIADQVLLIRELEGQALETFFALVSGPASESLGDGEAATLALAHARGCSAAIDEKKATRLATDRFTMMRLVTTVDILAHQGVRTGLGNTQLADAVFQALRVARMQVREQQFEWIARLIGPQNVEACSSLRRLARRRSTSLYRRGASEEDNENSEIQPRRKSQH